jgi:hypothetical protein
MSLYLEVRQWHDIRKSEQRTKSNVPNQFDNPWIKHIDPFCEHHGTEHCIKLNLR